MNEHVNPTQDPAEKDKRNESLAPLDDSEQNIDVGPAAIQSDDFDDAGPPRQAEMAASRLDDDFDTSDETEDKSKPEQTSPTLRRPRRKILIGSQRYSSRYRSDAGAQQQSDSSGEAAGKQQAALNSGQDVGEPERTQVVENLPEAAQESGEESTVDWYQVDEQRLPDLPEIPAIASTSAPVKYPPPRIPPKVSDELERELQEALGDLSIEELLSAETPISSADMLEQDAIVTGTVVLIHDENVFVDLGRREQGMVPLKQFEKPPEIGQQVNVRVVGYNAEDSLYELSLPGGAMSVEEWAELEQGMVVEARVTGYNTGGLECEVGHIRGFMPMSQVDLFRVEDPTPYVGQRFRCLVIEVNPERRRLVLSRRMLLEREREEKRRQLLDELEPGQVREGVIRKLVDYGAFVDLGGVDGLLHISQMGWHRVERPEELFHEGQRIQVKVLEVDKQRGRISLSYRELTENPWNTAAVRYPPNSQVRGKVVRVADYGAFVELEPGIEGLVHISELSHKKVWRVTDVVNVGDEVDVVVLSVDQDQRRISLSMKHLTPPAEEEKTEQVEEPEEKPAEQSKKKDSAKQPQQELKGGLGRSPMGNKFGLKW